MKKILSLLSVLLISACSDDGAPDGFKIIDGFKSGGMPITSTMQLPAEIREKRNYPNVYQDNIGFIVATPARIPIIEKKGIPSK